MKNLLLIIGLLFAACMSPSYPSIDRPSTTISSEDSDIIAYIDSRLEKEYYWLDEVVERNDSFDRHIDWEHYLDEALLMLTTNNDDGYINSKGQRVFYSYIREIDDSTRATYQTGFGIHLHYTIISVGNERLGLVVDHIYNNSPAHEAGIRRGDIIITIDGNAIDMNNYATLFNAIQNNSAAQLNLGLFRQLPADGEAESFTASLTKASYMPSPIIRCEVLDIADSDKRIGYMVYTQFKSEFNDELVAALQELSAAGVEHFILDLRNNGGGAVTSAIKLVSAMLGSEHAGELLCELKRNPQNPTSNGMSQCLLEDLGFSIGPKNFTIICSENSASASELVIMGLRGLDIPVTLIGSTTEGKNCGMDVTRRTIADKYVEYAPITFMCYNAKGFGDYGEGITPDIDVVNENQWGINDEYYPLPRCDWGVIEGDVALAIAVAKITGTTPSSLLSTRAEQAPSIVPRSTIERPFIGTINLCEE